jgi:hypothetical protein
MGEFKLYKKIVKLKSEIKELEGEIDYYKTTVARLAGQAEESRKLVTKQAELVSDLRDLARQAMVSPGSDVPTVYAADVLDLLDKATPETYASNATPPAPTTRLWSQGLNSE